MLVLSAATVNLLAVTAASATQRDEKENRTGRAEKQQNGELKDKADTPKGKASKRKGKSGNEKEAADKMPPDGKLNADRKPKPAGPVDHPSGDKRVLPAGRWIQVIEPALTEQDLLFGTGLANRQGEPVPKPTVIEIEPESEGLIITRDGRQTRFHMEKGTDEQRRVWVSESRAEQLIHSGPRLILVTDSRKVGYQRFSEKETRLKDLEGFWIGLDGYFRFRNSGDRLSAQENDLGPQLVVRNLTSTGFQLVHENATVHSSLEFFGSDAFGEVRVVDGRTVADRIFFRIQRQTVELEIRNEVNSELIVSVAPVMMSTGTGGTSGIFEGGRMILPKLPPGQTRKESLEVGSVIVFSDANGPLFRERITPQMPDVLRVRRSPTKGIDAEGISGNWLSESGRCIITKETSGLQLAVPGGVSSTASRPSNGQTHPSERGRAKKKREPAQSADRRSTMSFAQRSSGDQKNPNVYQSEDGATLEFFSPDEARIQFPSLIATTLQRKIKLGEFVPSKKPVDLTGYWANGSSVVEVSKNAEGDVNFGGTVVSLLEDNVYLSGPVRWVATDEDTIQQFHSDPGLANENLAWRRLHPPSLDRALVPLGLIDDSSVNPGGYWQERTPENSEVSTVAFELTSIGLFNGSKHFFRVQNSQNIFRDADHWYVFVSADLMFRSSAIGELSTFVRGSSSLNAASLVGGSGGFGSSISGDPPDLTGNWSAASGVNGNRVSQTWKISKEKGNRYRISNGPLLELTSAGVLTPFLSGGVGLQTVFLNRVENLTIVPRWETSPSALTETEIEEVKNLFHQPPKSLLLVSPDVIVESFDRPFPTVYRRLKSQNTGAEKPTATECVETYFITVRWLPRLSGTRSPFSDNNNWQLTLKGDKGKQVRIPRLLVKSDSPNAEHRQTCHTVVAAAYGPPLGEVTSVELVSEGTAAKFGQGVVQIQTRNSLDAVFFSDEQTPAWNEKQFRKPFMTVFNIYPFPITIPSAGEPINGTTIEFYDEAKAGALSAEFLAGCWHPAPSVYVPIPAEQQKPLWHGYDTGLLRPGMPNHFVFDSEKSPNRKMIVSMEPSGLAVKVKFSDNPDREFALRAIEMGMYLRNPLVQPHFWSSDDGRTTLAVSSNHAVWTNADTEEMFFQPLPSKNQRSLTLGTVQKTDKSDDENAFIREVLNRDHTPVVIPEHPEFDSRKVHAAYRSINETFRNYSPFRNGKQGFSFEECLARNYYPFESIDLDSSIRQAVRDVRAQSPGQDSLFNHIEEHLTEINSLQKIANGYFERSARKNHEVATETIAELQSAYQLLSLSGATAEDAPAPNVDLTGEQAQDRLFIALDVLSIAASWLPIFGSGLSKVADKAVQASSSIKYTNPQKAAKLLTIARSAKDADKAIRGSTDALQSFQLFLDTADDTSSIIGEVENLKTSDGAETGNVQKSSDGDLVWDLEKLTGPDQVHYKSAKICKELLEKFRKTDSALQKLSRLTAHDVQMMRDVVELEVEDRISDGESNQLQLDQEADFAQTLIRQQILMQLLPARIGLFSRPIWGDFQGRMGFPASGLRNIVATHGHLWKPQTAAMFTTLNPHSFEGSEGKFIVYYAMDFALIPTQMDTDKAPSGMPPALWELIQSSGITSEDLIPMVWENESFYFSPACRYYYDYSWAGWVPAYEPTARLKYYRREATYWWNDYYTDHDGYSRSYHYHEEPGDRDPTLKSSRIYWTKEALLNVP